MVDKPANTDQVIAKLAAKQHGVVSTVQLQSAGLTRAAIAKRAQAGRLHRLHRGVYAVGHMKLTFEGRCTAAILALGDGAAVSHRSAAALWGMIRAHRGPIEVTVPGNGGREKRGGIELHRSTSLIADLTSFCNGIRVTKPKRTLRDLHRISSQPAYRRAVRRALDLRLINSSDLKSDDDLTRSELERLFRKLCRRHGLPQPEVNAHVAAYEVDFLWRDHCVIVETDSWRHHGDRSAFERDRARDAHMQSLGFRVLRFTYRQVRDDGPGIATSLRAVFGGGVAT